MGEPGRLSLEETEWWRPEEKLRLLCITVLCLESFFKMLRRLKEEGSRSQICDTALFCVLNYSNDTRLKRVLRSLQIFRMLISFVINKMFFLFAV